MNKLVKKYWVFGVIALIVLGFLAVNLTTNKGGLTAWLSIGSTDETARQVKVTYGASNTVLNYVKTLGVTIAVQNTGGTDFTNVRVTASSPAVLSTKCNTPIASLAAGATGTISCSLTEAELNTLVGAVQQWTVTLTAYDTYRGVDLAPVTTANLPVTIAADPAGTFSVNMGVSKSE
jgi:hypothetical protein